MEQNKPGAKPGERRAAKPPEEVKTSRMVIRCRQEDKARWVHASNVEGKKLAVWVEEQLNKAAMEVKW
jgi:predicted HicB family RNase H-like nuclease